VDEIRATTSCGIPGQVRRRFQKIELIEEYEFFIEIAMGTIF